MKKTRSCRKKLHRLRERKLELSQVVITSLWVCTLREVSLSKSTMIVKWCFHQEAVCRTMLLKASLQMLNVAWLKAARSSRACSKWTETSCTCQSNFLMNKRHHLVANHSKAVTQWSTLLSLKKMFRLRTWIIMQTIIACYQLLSI